jgi:hypothetical protein
MCRLQGESALHQRPAHGSWTATLNGRGFGLPEDCDESFRRLIDALVTGLQPA